MAAGLLRPADRAGAGHRHPAPLGMDQRVVPRAGLCGGLPAEPRHGPGRDAGRLPRALCQRPCAAGHPDPLPRPHPGPRRPDGHRDRPLRRLCGPRDLPRVAVAGRGGGHRGAADVHRPHLDAGLVDRAGAGLGSGGAAGGLVAPGARASGPRRPAGAGTADAAGRAGTGEGPAAGSGRATGRARGADRNADAADLHAGAAGGAGSGAGRRVAQPAGRAVRAGLGCGGHRASAAGGADPRHRLGGRPSSSASGLGRCTHWPMAGGDDRAGPALRPRLGGPSPPGPRRPLCAGLHRLRADAAF